MNIIIYGRFVSFHLCAITKLSSNDNTCMQNSYCNLNFI